MEKNLVLFSGGIDSTTALYWVLDFDKQTTALTFDYGQKNRIEIQAAQRIASMLEIPHKILHVDLEQIGGSCLTDSSFPLSQMANISQIHEGLPTTYVPFRNGIFLALAAAWAETMDITGIVCGFNVIDSPNYPDTRETFVKAMEKAINSGTGAALGRKKIGIFAPFLNMSKSAIIQQGLALGADYSYSISCYRGEEIPCLQCSSCLLRQKAWEETGMKDPLIARLEKEGRL
ncbi:MAG: 7-cyano-7-deazaguanine synthase QueC [Candidatus Aminicenantes bacterium]|nr:MAG: 7-cyano-7-deazaguanine synthase QueC [Candidatus Aminicenantes bacterium]